MKDSKEILNRLKKLLNEAEESTNEQELEDGYEHAYQLGYLESGIKRILSENDESMPESEEYEEYTDGVSIVDDTNLDGTNLDDVEDEALDEVNEA